MFNRISSYISNNILCPPYPDCVQNYIGYQDTTECINECPSLTGDLNDDSTINILDILIMVNCILSDNCNECSDLNNDQSTNILDILQLINITLGD